MASDARTLAEKHYEGFNTANLELAGSIHSDDVELRVPGAGAMTGAAAWTEYTGPFLSGFPGAKIHADNYIESGDTIVVEGHFSGENTGPLMTPMGELPATGKSIDLPFADIFRVKDGKVVSHHVYYDQADFMTQLGLMPTPEGS
jgi:steroid delta-isomerase-like uncharacterized protein